MKLPYTIFRKRSLEEIDNLLIDLTRLEQKGLKREVYKELRSKYKNLNESQRVSLVKLLLWSLPESEPQIYFLLAKMEDRKDFEIHFTIFCFLDQAINQIKDAKLRQRLFDATKSYLTKVNKDYAHSAWMAGEFLGAHTDQKISLPILKSAFDKINHTPGKKAVLFGLYRIAEKSNNSASFKIIKSASEIEEDRNIRIYAKNLLEKLNERLKAK